MSLLQRYSFNEMITVPIELMYGFIDTTIEVTIPVIIEESHRYRGEFQNMGPKIRAIRAYQKDPVWLYDPK